MRLIDVVVEMAEVNQIKAGVLAGEYADIFWTLEPVTIYVAGTQVYARVYVGNLTEEDREYLLMAVVSRRGVEITEFPVKVNDITWFEVKANSVVTLPGAFEVAYTDVIFTLNLYEKEENDIVDSVSTALTSAGTGELAFPPIPGAPEAPDTISSIMPMITTIIMIMMFGMMMRSMLKEK